MNVKDFHTCSIDKTACIVRLKIKFEHEFEAFIKSWSNTSNVTWRVSSTSPSTMSAGNKNIFWKAFHCQSSNYNLKPGASRHKKHTGCPARMTVTIKKVTHRCKYKDKQHMPEYPTIIKVWNNHNHQLDSADNVRYKDVSADTKQKIQSLFAMGHSPCSALDLYKTYLMQEYGDKYDDMIADRSICPDVQWLYRFFNKINKTTMAGCNRQKDVEYHNTYSNKSHHVGRKKTIICIECNTPVVSRKLLRIHCSKSHQMELKEEIHSFQSDTEFINWRMEVEKKNYCRFVLKRAVHSLEIGTKKKYFFCRPDSCFGLKLENNKRVDGSRSSKRINASCPAEIIYNEIAGGYITIQYWNNHLGHYQNTISIAITGSIPERGLLLDEQVITSHPKLSDIIITKLKELVWIAQPSTSNATDVQYVITQLEKNGTYCEAWEQCFCKCLECAICIHTYSCECADYMIKNSICEHIHACAQSNDKCASIDTFNSNCVTSTSLSDDDFTVPLSPPDSCSLLESVRLKTETLMSYLTPETNLSSEQIASISKGIDKIIGDITSTCTFQLQNSGENVGFFPKISANASLSKLATNEELNLINDFDETSKDNNSYDHDYF